ncbi:MAG: LytTR family DNA-binding domain-containing protein [Pseudomonadota bacterium]
MNRPQILTQVSGNPRYLRLLALFLCLVAISQFSDPLGDIPVADIILFWTARLGTVALSLLFAELLLVRFARHRLNSPKWLKPAVISILIAAIPMTVVEIMLELSIPQAAAYDDTDFHEVSLLLAFAGEYLTLLSIILPVNALLWVFLENKEPELRNVLTPDVQPEFLNKSNGISATDVLALEAQEHYVNVRTDQGNELIYTRLSDAVQQMPTELGTQVHRSWWVADRAVVSAHRATRRYRLQLGDGTQVPVSDKFAKVARDRGFFRRKS